MKRKLTLTHPQHAILGLAAIIVGIILICNDFYFFYPPFLARFLNDDAFGTLGIVLGVNLIVWSVRDSNSIKTNLLLLLASCAFWAYESSALLVHAVVAHNAYMLTGSVLEAIIFLFTLSVIGRSPKTKHSEYLHTHKE